MSNIIDLRKAQAALDKAAASNDRTGRFGLKANMPRIKSSMMTAVDYHYDSCELDITFVSGKTYRYSRVPPEIYDGLLDADSKGEFFNERIKDKFGYREVASPSR
jgi:hypothetical protein